MLAQCCHLPEGSFRLVVNLLQRATVTVCCSKNRKNTNYLQRPSPLQQSLRLVWMRLNVDTQLFSLQLLLLHCSKVTQLPLQNWVSTLTQMTTFSKESKFHINFFWPNCAPVDLKIITMLKLPPCVPLWLDHASHKSLQFGHRCKAWVNKQVLQLNLDPTGFQCLPNTKSECVLFIVAKSKWNMRAPYFPFWVGRSKRYV